MEDKPRGPIEKRPTSAIAIAVAATIAFVPFILAIGVFALGGNAPPSGVLLAVAATGIFGCLVAAYMLKRSESGWTLLLGVVSLFANLAISVFFGLGAYASALGSHQ